MGVLSSGLWGFWFRVLRWRERAAGFQGSAVGSGSVLQVHGLMAQLGFGTS